MDTRIQVLQLQPLETRGQSQRAITRAAQ